MEIIKFTCKWVDLEITILHEVTQTQKDTSCSVGPLFESLDMCVSWSAHRRQDISKGMGRDPKEGQQNTGNMEGEGE